MAAASIPQLLSKLRMANIVLNPKSAFSMAHLTRLPADSSQEVRAKHGKNGHVILYVKQGTRFQDRLAKWGVKPAVDRITKKRTKAIELFRQALEKDFTKERADELSWNGSGALKTSTMGKAVGLLEARTALDKSGLPWKEYLSPEEGAEDALLKHVADRMDVTSKLRQNSARDALIDWIVDRAAEREDGLQRLASDAVKHMALETNQIGSAFRSNSAICVLFGKVLDRNQGPSEPVVDALKKAYAGSQPLAADTMPGPETYTLNFRRQMKLARELVMEVPLNEKGLHCGEEFGKRRFEELTVEEKIEARRSMADKLVTNHFLRIAPRLQDTLVTKQDRESTAEEKAELARANALGKSLLNGVAPEGLLRPWFDGLTKAIDETPSA